MTFPVPQVLSTGFGLLMAAVTAVGSPRSAAAVAAVTVIAVLVGVVFRAAATLAVLLAVATIALADSAPTLAAVSGLAAVAYLLLRYAADGAATVTTPTIIAALGFTFVGLVATAFPLQVPWLPVLAPLAALGCYGLVTRPFLGDRG